MPWFACGSHAANFPAVEISWGNRLKFSREGVDDSRAGEMSPTASQDPAEGYLSRRSRAVNAGQHLGSLPPQSGGSVLGPLVAWEGWLWDRSRNTHGRGQSTTRLVSRSGAARRHGALGHLLPSLSSPVNHATSHARPAQQDILRPEKGACMAPSDR